MMVMFARAQLLLFIGLTVTITGVTSKTNKRCRPKSHCFVEKINKPSQTNTNPNQLEFLALRSMNMHFGFYIESLKFTAGIFIQMTHVLLWGYWYPCVGQPEWVALFMRGRINMLHIPSGVTPSDLFATIMAAKPFSSAYLWAGNSFFS